MPRSFDARVRVEVTTYNVHPFSIGTYSRCFKAFCGLYYMFHQSDLAQSLKCKDKQSIKQINKQTDRQIDKQPTPRPPWNNFYQLLMVLPFLSEHTFCAYGFSSSAKKLTYAGLCLSFKLNRLRRESLKNPGLPRVHPEKIPQKCVRTMQLLESPSVLNLAAFGGKRWIDFQRFTVN